MKNNFKNDYNYIYMNNNINNNFDSNSNNNKFDSAIQIIKNELIFKDNIINMLNEKIINLKQQIEECEFLLQHQEQQKQNLNNYNNYNNNSHNFNNKNNINKQNYSPLNLNLYSSNKINTPSVQSNENINKHNVKAYLQEVKSKIDSKMFKEFIVCIKLINSQKNNDLIKEKVINDVKNLFGETYKDLYDKFEKVLNIRK